MAVTSAPRTTLQIAFQSCHARFNLANFGECGRSSPHGRIEERVWTCPVRSGKAVSAVMGYADRSGRYSPVCATKLAESGEVHAVLFLQRWEIIVSQPEPWDVRIPSQEHDASPGDAPELSKRPRSLVPVMNSQYGHDDIGASVAKRKVCGARLYGWGHPRRSLANHRHGGLDCHDAASGGFIGACARANIDNAAIDSEGIIDRLTDPWIRNPLSPIANAYGVVEQKPGLRFT